MSVLAALRRDASGQAVATGAAAAVLGYASTVAVLVTGLTAAGASPDQVGTALLAVGVLLAVTSVVLSAGTRVPVAAVWSTPGLALLIAVGSVAGGLPAVVGAFALGGLLITVTGLVPPLVRLLARLPAALTSAVLAGVLLPFCLAVVPAVQALPLQAGAIVLAWLAAVRWAPRWSAPTALLALVAVVAAEGTLALPAGPALLPQLHLVEPTLTWQAVTDLALPLFVVTMAGQNLVGIAVLQAHGYRPPVRAALVGTGLASVAGAPFAAPTVNLAAITGALTAGPTAHEDPARRWVSTAAAGACYLLLALLAPVTAALVTQTDPRLVATAAGLALLAPLAGALSGALGGEQDRLAAVLTLVVTASGVTAAGLGSAPLGLLAGAVVLLLARRGQRSGGAGTASPDSRSAASTSSRVIPSR